MVLAWIDDELWRGQAQNGVNLAFQVKFDLEGQGQSHPKTIGTLTKLFCTFCPNLVVLAWTRGDLWRGQAQGWRTHTQTDTHTDRQTQATTIPEGQNWPRVINCYYFNDILNLVTLTPMGWIIFWQNKYTFVFDHIAQCWNTCIQIKYGLPYCVTCPSMSTDPGSLNPGTRRSRVPGWRDPGIRTNTGAGDTDLAKHT